MMTPAFSIHLAATWALVGLIWCVQALIYPQFHHFDARKFRECHFRHCFRIAFIVVPLMLVEVVSAGWLLYQGFRAWPFILSVWLIPVVWISTAIWQAPLHTRLICGFDAPLLRKLILTNWVRTVTWTARGILVSLCVA